MPKLKGVEVKIFIDDVELKYTGFREGMLGGSIGGQCGQDYYAYPGQEVIASKVTGIVFMLAVERDEPPKEGETKGTYWGCDALYRRGEWSAGEKDCVIYKVWERII